MDLVTEALANAPVTVTVLDDKHNVVERFEFANRAEAEPKIQALDAEGVSNIVGTDVRGYLAERGVDV